MAARHWFVTLLASVMLVIGMAAAPAQAHKGHAEPVLAHEYLQVGTIVDYR